MSNTNLVISNSINLSNIKVVSINKIEYKEKIYSMEVKKNHNYFIGNILSKNCQNMTPLGTKSLLSRVGEGSKIVCCGDIHQIDNPYLDEYSNGLSVLVNAVKDSELTAHITLTKTERSKLAELIAEVL